MGTEVSSLELVQHSLKFRSSADGRPIPVHVSAPRELLKTRLPVVLLLHDSAVDPSPAAFVEEAFRQAAAWKSAMSESPPGLLVQVWGRGNSAWLGPAGKSLFDVWDELQHHFLMAPTASVIGFGSGGTGALQLAATFPERFHSVAAVNPWTDDRLFLPLGTKDYPVWEAAARKEIRPVDLAAKLTGKQVLVGHAPIGDSFAALAAMRHVEAFRNALTAAGIECRDISVRSNPFSEQHASLDLNAIWRSLACGGEGGSRKGVEFPRRLFWRPLSIVVGTLGESADSDAMRGFAERLCGRWLSGEDSCHPHLGRRELVKEIPILSDAHAIEETPDGDLVILGSPRLNLLAAKWPDRLAAKWPSKETDEFAILGRTFADPAAFVVARKERPDGHDGETWIASANSTDAWVDLDRLRFAFLPPVFVQPSSGEVLWMEQGERGA
jgi:pimeloyl-ACP methyl ester carboxylesterase